MGLARHLIGGFSPPNFLPACNVAMTHNFNGANGGIASIGGAAGGNASSVLFREVAGNVGAWLMNGSSIAKSAVLATCRPLGRSSGSVTSTATAMPTFSGATLAAMSASG